MSVSLMIPTTVVLSTIFIYVYLGRKLHRRVARYGKAEKRKALGILFDFADYDESGTINNREFSNLMKMLHGKKPKYLDNNQIQTDSTNKTKKKKKKKKKIRRNNLTKSVEEQRWNSLMLQMGGFSVTATSSDNYCFDKIGNNIVTIGREAFVRALLDAALLEDYNDSNRALDTRSHRNSPTTTSSNSKNNNDDDDNNYRQPRDKTTEISIGQFISIRKSMLWIKQNQLFSLCASTCTQLLLLLHAPVSAKSFHYFDCHVLSNGEPVDSSNYKSFLRRDYSLQCGSAEYELFLPVAFGLLFGFAILLPLVLGIQVFKHWNELHIPATKSRIGWLYPRFVHGAEFWEIHEVLRKMLLTGIIIYFSPNVRALVAVWICFVGTCSLNYYRPHKSTILFWIAQGSFVLTTAKYLMTVYGMLQSKNLTTTEIERLGQIMIVFDCIIIVGSHLLILGLFVLLRVTVKNLKDIENATAKEQQDIKDNKKTKIVPFNAIKGGIRGSVSGRSRDRLMDRVVLDRVSQDTTLVETTTTTLEVIQTKEQTAIKSTKKKNNESTMVKPAKPSRATKPSRPTKSSRSSQLVSKEMSETTSMVKLIKESKPTMPSRPTNRPSKSSRSSQGTPKLKSKETNKLSVLPELKFSK